MNKSILKNKIKLVVILGPTASGKTGLGVKLADKYDGEIVSADSRQVYIGMDIGTGKDLAEYDIKDSETGKIRHIPYHLIDVVKPTADFDVAKYQNLAGEAIDDINSRGKLPLLVGGTGLYLQAIVDNYDFSRSATDHSAQIEMEKQGVAELLQKLEELNPRIAAGLNQSDRNNKRRLIRLIEICVQDKDFDRRKKKEEKYDCLLIGLTWPREVLAERINWRLLERLEKEDMIGEVSRLQAEGVTWRRLESFGLEYKFISQYLQEKLSYEEMVEKLNIAIRQFAKRQLTWFRRWEKQGREIHWLEDGSEANGLIDEFLEIK